MDTKINYQPTGIYSGYLDGSSNKAKPKQKKKIPFVQIGIAAVALGAASYGISKYNKGMEKVLNRKELIGDYPTIQDFFAIKKPPGEKTEYERIWNEAQKVLDGPIGKVHRFLSGIGNFFKKTFYNY